MTDQSLYERLGRREGIESVVETFYDRLVADDLLGPFFEDADLERLRETQADHLCEAAGGPERYTATPVREAHLHVPFEPRHIGRAVEILESTLEDAGVTGEDKAAVVGAVTRYEDDLLARD